MAVHITQNNWLQLGSTNPLTDQIFDFESGPLSFDYTFDVNACVIVAYEDAAIGSIGNRDDYDSSKDSAFNNAPMMAEELANAKTVTLDPVQIRILEELEGYNHWGVLLQINDSFDIAGNFINTIYPNFGDPYGGFPGNSIVTQSLKDVLPGNTNFTR